jgi:hypothetical protein
LQIGASLLVLVLVYNGGPHNILQKLGKHGWMDYPWPTIDEPGSVRYLYVLGLYTYIATVMVFIMTHLVVNIAGLSKNLKVIPTVTTMPHLNVTGLLVYPRLK